VNVLVLSAWMTEPEIHDMSVFCSLFTVATVIF